MGYADFQTLAPAAVLPATDYGGAPFVRQIDTPQDIELYYPPVFSLAQKPASL